MSENQTRCYMKAIRNPNPFKDEPIKTDLKGKELRPVDRDEPWNDGGMDFTREKLFDRINRLRAEYKSLAEVHDICVEERSELKAENERLRGAAVAMITGYYAELNFLDIEEKAPLLLVKGYVDALSQALEEK